MRRRRLTHRDLAIRAAAFLVEFAVCVAAAELIFWGVNQWRPAWPDTERGTFVFYSHPSGGSPGKMALPTSVPASLRRPDGSQLKTPSKPYADSDHSQEFPPGFFFMGRKPLFMPGFHGRSRVTVRATGQTVFDVPLSTDASGRRLTAAPRGKVRQFLAVFGCSFVFGTGVGDGETLPSQIAKNAPGVAAYNYGIPGAGPIEALLLLKDPGSEAHVPRLPGQGVFVVMSDHIRRVSPSISNLKRFEGGYFEEGGDQGGVVLRKSFREAHPFRAFLYGALKRSQVLKFFAADFPMFLGDSQARLIAKLLKRMQYEWRQKFPGMRFTVVLYPGIGELGPVLARLLDSMDVPYLDYGDVSLDDAIGERWTVSEYEGHPSARANAWLGKQIARDLGLAAQHESSFTRVTSAGATE